MRISNPTKLILVITFIFLLPLTSSHAALYIDETSTTDKGHLDLGFSFDYYTDEEKVYDSETEDYTKEICKETDLSMDLTLGLTDKWDIGVDLPYAFVNDSSSGRVNGFCDFTLSSKYRLWDEDDYLPSYALSFDFKMDNANEEKDLGTGRHDYTITNIFTKSLSNFIMDLNLGYSLVGGQADNIFIYCFDFTNDLTENISLCNEIYGESIFKNKFNDNVLIFASSLAFQLNQRVSLESGIGIGISKASPDFQISSSISFSF